MEKQIFKNNLVVYYYPIDTAYSTSIGLYVNSGSSQELEEKNGITHLLEHLHFRRLGELEQRDLYVAMDKIGASLRAMTHKECMRFYLKVRPVFFRNAIEFFSKIISMYEWTDEDFEAEKKIVLNELASKESQVYTELIMDKIVWERHPLGMPIIGTTESINNLKLDDIIEYKRAAFSSGNIALIITGNITEEMKRDVSSLFANITLSEFVPKKEKGLNFYNKKGPNIKLLPYQWDCVDVKLSFRVVDVLNSYELMVLNSILGGGTGAKLQYVLREKLALTSDIYSYVESYSAGSDIRIALTTHKNHIYDCIEAIINIVEDLKYKITNEDMATNLPYFTENLWYWIEDTSLLNSELGWEVFRQYKPLTIEDRIKEYQQVTKENLMSMAQKIFLPENVSLLIVGSVGSITKKKLKQLLAEKEDKGTVLLS